MMSIMHIFEQRILYHENLKCLQSVKNFNFYDNLASFAECFVHFDNNANKKLEMFYVKIEIENEIKIIDETKEVTKFKKSKNVAAIKNEMYKNIYEDTDYESNNIEKMNIEKNEKMNIEKNEKNESM